MDTLELAGSFSMTELGGWADGWVGVRGWDV